MKKCKALFAILSLTTLIGFMSVMLLPALAAAAKSATIDKSVYTVGETIIVTTENWEDADTELLRIYTTPVTNYNAGFVAQNYNDWSKSTYTFSTATWAPGTYRLMAFDKSQWTNIIADITFQVVETLEKGMVIGNDLITRGDPIELTYKNTDGTDTIGIYPEGFTDYIKDRKIAINCANTTSTKVMPSSSQLEQGNYVAILWESGWKEVARCTFMVFGGNEYYVSSQGNDADIGTKSAPMKTVKAAQNKINNGNGCIIILDEAVYDADEYNHGTITIVGDRADAKLLYGGADLHLRADTVLSNLTLTQDGDNKAIYTNGFSLKIEETVTYTHGSFSGYESPVIVTGKTESDYERIALIGGTYQEIVIGKDGHLSDSTKLWVDGAQVKKITITSADEAANIRAVLDNGSVAAVSIDDNAEFSSLQMIAKNGSQLQAEQITGKTWYIVCEDDEKGRVDFTDTTGTFNVVSGASKTPMAVSEDGTRVYVAGPHTSSPEMPRTNYQHHDYADYIQYRKPLTNTYQKLTKDKQLKIVYFGGSVTAGYGSSNGSYSWRALSERWFKDNFPQANITAINTAIGESGTFLGTYRLQKDVIEQQPDLLFIEYAINDKYKGSSKETAALQYETIVREVKQALPLCDIVTLLVIDRSTADLLPDLYPTAAGHEMIAELYQIPTINVGRSLVESMSNYTDAQEWGKYFIDTVHPTDEGYRKYYNCLEEYLKNSLLHTDFDEAAASIDNLIPVYSAHLLDGDRRSIMGEDMQAYVLPDTKGFTYSAEQYYGPVQTPHNGYYYANKATADAEIAFRFTGTEFAVWTNFYASSKISYSIDGGSYQTISCDNHAPTQIVSNLNSGEHVIRIRPVSYGSDTGDIMKIGAIFTRDASKQTVKGATFTYPDIVNGTFVLPAGKYTVRYVEGPKVSDLPIPEAQEGYRFVGWKNADGVLVASGYAMKTGDVLTAYFEKINPTDPTSSEEQKETTQPSSTSTTSKSPATGHSRMIWPFILTGCGVFGSLAFLCRRREVLHRHKRSI